jgi:hypothetical protein
MRLNYGYSRRAQLRLQNALNCVLLRRVIGTDRDGAQILKWEVFRLPTPEARAEPLLSEYGTLLRRIGKIV